MWYYEYHGQQGPVNLQDLISLFKQGILNRQTRVWTEGMTNWEFAYTVNALHECFPYDSVDPDGVYETSYSSESLKIMAESIKKAWTVYRNRFHMALGLVIILVICPFLTPLFSSLGRDGSVYSDAFSIFTYAVFLILIIYMIFTWLNSLILTYRIWKSVPPNIAYTSPGMAIALLFVPLFNIYWVFITYGKLTSHLYLLGRKVGLLKNHSSLAVLYCVTSLIPYFNFLLAPFLKYFLLQKLSSLAVEILAQNPNEVDDPGDRFPQKDDNIEPWIFPVRTSGMAILSGYLGLFSILLIPAPFAILTGFLALNHMKKQPGLLGYGRAWFGIITGSFMTLVLIIMLILLIG